MHKGSPIIPNLLTLMPINLRYILMLSSNKSITVSRGIIPTGLPIKMLKVLIPSFIVATYPDQFNTLDLITLNILRETHEPRCELFSTAYYHLGAKYSP